MHSDRALSAVRAARILMLIVLLAAAGCATSDAPAPSGVAADPKSRDTLDCMSQAREMRPSAPGIGTGAGSGMTVNQDRYQACMRARGHTTGQ